MKAWFDIGFIAHEVLNLTPEESYTLCKEGAIIVDVREEYMNSFKMFKVERLICLPFSEMEQLYSKLPTDEPLIFADAVGLKSRECVLFMNSHGYDNVANMAGGIVDWERDGLPLTTDINSRLSGSCMCQLKARENQKDKPNNYTMKHSLGFIGGGRVTKILLQGFKNKNVKFSKVVVTDTNPEVIANLQKQFPEVEPSDVKKAAGQDVVFIALHPPVVMDTLELIKNDVKAEAIVISLAPKINLPKLTMKLGHVKNLARLIPNATSYINEGYNPVTFAAEFDPVHKKEVMDLLSSLGTTFEVSEEKLESYAILSAMLPTYFWFQWRELGEIGGKIGLSEEESKKSIYDTIIASLNLMYKSGLSASDVIDLIPVKPIGEHEPQISEIYKTKLIGLFEKIKP